MIYFDKKTLSVLKYINRRSNYGAEWGKIIKKFSYVDFSFLEQLSQEEYTSTKNANGRDIIFPDNFIQKQYNFKSYISHRGREILERKSFDFWKWVIPTLISVAALITSILTFICRHL